MAPLSCCDLTSLDETFPLKHFPFSRSNLAVEARTSTFDNDSTEEKQEPSCIMEDSSASYWDWPSVDHAEVVVQQQQDSMMDLFSGSHIERNLKATAAKLMKKFENDDDEECVDETHSTEPVKGPLGTCYWDWSADHQDLKQATCNHNLAMNPGMKELATSSPDDPSSFDYFNWPSVGTEEALQALDEDQMPRIISSDQTVLREYCLTSPATSRFVQETVSERYWLWSHTTSCC